MDCKKSKCDWSLFEFTLEELGLVPPHTLTVSEKQCSEDRKGFFRR